MYSIDRFSFMFHFFPQQDNFFELLKNSFDGRNNMDTWRSMSVQSGERKESIYGVPVAWWQFGMLHVELWNTLLRKSSVKVDFEKCPSAFQTHMRLDFNPNTLGENPVFSALCAFLRSTDVLYKWSMTRCDYCWDIPLRFSDVYVFSRKAMNTYGTTRYFGRRGSSGMLRVYDKTIDMRQNHKTDIGRLVTRCEWEQRNNRDFQFVFDTVCRADWSSLTGGQRALQFVSPEFMNDALRCFQKHTAVKIKKQCFAALPFDASVFRSLLNEYLSDFGFNPDFRQDYDAQFPAADDGEADEVQQQAAQEHDISIDAILQEFERKMAAPS